MLHIRPHHLIDIIRNIGQGRPVVPHPYGHAQHTITQTILAGTVREISFVIGADDLCKPCIHLTAEGICKDILPQLEYRVLKQEYNDDLDRRVMEYLGLKENATVSLAAFLDMIEKNMAGLVTVCTHPKEDESSRRFGLEKGIAFVRGGWGEWEIGRVGEGER
ncbi:MAG: DUF1284 domain-containing protein [Bacteroidales bacterium]|nr:DUF1284 domain-containing protein [Bacteroidales bacterium]